MFKLFVMFFSDSSHLKTFIIIRIFFTIYANTNTKQQSEPDLFKCPASVPALLPYLPSVLNSFCHISDQLGSMSVAIGHWRAYNLLILPGLIQSVRIHHCVRPHKKSFQVPVTGPVGFLTFDTNELIRNIIILLTNRVI